MGVVGLAENKANSAPIELELWLSLAIIIFKKAFRHSLKKVSAYFLLAVSYQSLKNLAFSKSVPTKFCSLKVEGGPNKKF